jgi:cytochrome b561
MRGGAAPSYAYDPIAKALHWLTVGLLCAQYTVAWTMPEIHSKTPAEGLISLHLSFGAAIFFTVIIRGLWRLARPAPPAPAHLAPWQVLAARGTHALLYALLIVLPLLGWAHASYRGYAVSLFSIVPLPSLVPKGSPIGRPLGDVHVAVAYALLAVIALHVAAAAWHRLVLRDEVLQRMLPARG